MERGCFVLRANIAVRRPRNQLSPSDGVLLVLNVVEVEGDRRALRSNNPGETGLDVRQVLAFEVNRVLLPVFGQRDFFQFAFAGIEVLLVV